MEAVGEHNQRPHAQSSVCTPHLNLISALRITIGIVQATFATPKRGRESFIDGAAQPSSAANASTTAALGISSTPSPVWRFGIESASTQAQRIEGKSLARSKR